MRGLMQDWPLLLHRIIDHAAVQHARREIVSRSVEGPIHRTDYVTLRHRALQVAKRLGKAGIRPGDRIGTLAWNTWRHVEAWYGIAGVGAVYHTINPRLFPEQIAWIINHAEDRMMLVDLTFVPLLEVLADRLPTIETYVVLTDAAHMPETRLRNAVAYEDWLAEADGDFAWHAVDENDAVGLCYTSGTTGMPKGVLYSHRSNVLHAMQLCATESFCPTAQDRFLVVVPMFHANAWALTYALPMAGGTMIMPGPRLDGASVFDLMESEAVTMSAGVPTVWMMLIDHMRTLGRKPQALRRVAVGGSACPQSMVAAFEQEFGVDLFHAWGMTETSPVGSVGSVKPEQAHLEGEALFAHKAKQGHAPFGVEMIITDDHDTRLPWDGAAFGRLKVRGPCISSGYFRDDSKVLDADGFFDTNDIATIAPDGTMQITDRAKDVIKSGGEWISSIEIENLAVALPDVAEAAVIGIAHPKWAERPLLVIVPAERTPQKAEVLDLLAGRIARWWIPDDVQVVGQIPHTAAGKIDKVGLRALFKDYRWPSTEVPPDPK